MKSEEFIVEHRNEDVRSLALQGKRYPEVDMPYALDQIAGWQMARTKLPSWASVEGLIYPPHISMEQCSSEATALYKSRIVGLLGEKATMVDLTGGFGVDFSFMARMFDKATYVERQEHLCEIAVKNFDLLGLNHADVVCGDGIEYLRHMQPVDLIYLDPARRDINGARTYALEDCTPNVIELKELLLEKGRKVMIKLSPMLDWHKAVESLRDVSEVHVVSVGNECKEMLLIMQKYPEKTHVFCSNDNNTFCVTDALTPICYMKDSPQVGQLLFVPNASVMKVGCFGDLCKQFGMKAVGKNSNLFILPEGCETETIPGRLFDIVAVSTMNKKDLKNNLSGILQANIAVRNFPLSAQDLCKRLKLRDGGDTYLFGTTDINDEHIIICCRKTLSAEVGEHI